MLKSGIQLTLRGLPPGVGKAFSLHSMRERVKGNFTFVSERKLVDEWGPDGSFHRVNKGSVYVV